MGRGETGRDLARLATGWQAWQNKATLGMARLGMMGWGNAGKAGRPGEARHDGARRGPARQATSGGRAKMDKIKEGVQQVVNDLYTAHGEVKPSDLVSAARPKASPAHKGFQWDNKRAADEYRLWQARFWIKRVTIVVEDREEQLVHISATSCDPETTETREGSYKPISVVVQNKDEYTVALSDTLARLKSAQKAYQDLKQIAKKRDQQPFDFQAVEAGFEVVEKQLTA